MLTLMFARHVHATCHMDMPASKTSEDLIWLLLPYLATLDSRAWAAKEGNLGSILQDVR